tara:strand:+ start:3242 stop:3376 length:135 start_codon:yes stop_codon:yes gene_type:complete
MAVKSESWLLRFEDGLTVVSGIIATLVGLLIVLMGVYVRDGRIK